MLKVFLEGCFLAAMMWMIPDKRLEQQLPKTLIKTYISKATKVMNHVCYEIVATFHLQAMN